MFQINQRSSTPIYQQLVQEVKAAILRGVVHPGDRLPSVRELAGRLAINPNTIQRSYQELERQKVIETLRGKGTFVCLDYRVKEDEEKISVFTENLRPILVEAHYLGLNQERILALVERLLHELGIEEGTG